MTPSRVHRGTILREILTCNHFRLPIFGRQFLKRFALCYRTVVLSVCLSVTLAEAYLQAKFHLDPSNRLIGWIKMKLGVAVGLGPAHIVLDGDPTPPP